MSRSSTLRNKFRQKETENNLKNLQILGFCPTRWGSARNCLSRILERWDEIIELFGEEHSLICKEEPEELLIDHSENNTEEEEEWDLYSQIFKTQESDQCITTELEEKTVSTILDYSNAHHTLNMKQYIEFTYIILDVIMQKNLLFMSDQISVVNLSSELTDLCLTLSGFILKDSKQDGITTERLYSIFKPENLIRKKLQEWYNPASFHSYQSFIAYLKLRYPDILYEDIIENEDWSLNCMRMIYESIYRLLTYIPYKDPVLQKLECLQLSNINIDDWKFFAEKFSNIIDKKDVSKLVLELDRMKRDKKSINELKTNHAGNLLSLWKAIKQENKYVLTSELAFALFNLPVSSAFVERSFKAVKLIKDSKRNRLGTESVEALLLVKINSNKEKIAELDCFDEFVQFDQDRNIILDNKTDDTNEDDNGNKNCTVNHNENNSENGNRDNNKIVG